MGRSFSFDKNGLVGVDGVGIQREAGEVALVTGHSVEMAQNPNYKAPELISSAPTGFTPSLG